MTKLEFVAENSQITAEEVLKLNPEKSAVVVTENGCIYTSNSINNALEGMFDRSRLNHINTKTDKLYFFSNSQEINYSMNRDPCLDRFRFAIPATKVPDKETQVRQWLKEYKCVGHINRTHSTKEKRHTLIIANNVASIRNNGHVGTYNVFINNLNSDAYCDYVGFHNEYDFFTWLNT